MDCSGAVAIELHCAETEARAETLIAEPDHILFGGGFEASSKAVLSGTPSRRNSPAESIRVF